jgi:hypothetical protein
LLQSVSVWLHKLTQKSNRNFCEKWLQAWSEVAEEVEQQAIFPRLVLPAKLPARSLKVPQLLFR